MSKEDYTPGASELLRLIEQSNNRLKRRIADLMLEKHVLTEVIDRDHTPRASSRAGALAHGDRWRQLCAGLSVARGTRVLIRT